MKLRKGIKEEEIYKILDNAISITIENYGLMNASGSLNRILGTGDPGRNQVTCYLVVTIIDALFKELGVEQKPTPLWKGYTYDSYYQNYIFNYLPAPMTIDSEEYYDEIDEWIGYNNIWPTEIAPFSEDILKITGLLNKLFYAGTRDVRSESYYETAYTWENEQWDYLSSLGLDKTADDYEEIFSCNGSYVAFLCIGGKKLMRIMQRNKKMPQRWRSLTNKAYKILTTSADQGDGKNSGFKVIKTKNELNIYAFRTDELEFDETISFENLGNTYLIGAIVLAAIDVVQKRYLNRNRREL